MFIYKITNTINNKSYIGQSIRPIEQRFKRHINDALNNVLDTHFARAIRKYGANSFKLELIDTAETQEELNLKEQKYIREYNSIENGYNETDALNKCGGNTYQSKTNEEIIQISIKISKSKIGVLNPNHKAVKVKNELTNEEIFFDTVKDCQKYFNEESHRFITTRVLGITKSLYNGVWNIAYANDEYNEMSKKIIRKRYLVYGINIHTFERKEFKSFSQMCRELGVDRRKIKNGTNTIIGDYQIFFS